MVKIIDPALFREALGHYPTGVAAVTAVGEDGNPAGMIVGTFSSVSLDPALIAFFPAKGSESFARLRTADAFCVNVLAADQEALCRQLATGGAAKFDGVSWRPGPLGSPVLEAAVSWIECTFEEIREAGDHYVVLGRVHEFAVERSTLPLLFFQGGYGRFSPRSFIATPDPELIQAAQVAETIRSHVEDLGAECGVNVSVVAKIHRDSVQVLAANQGSVDEPFPLGHRQPLLPPFGAVFMVNSPEAEIDEWLGRAPDGSQDRRARNRALLDKVRRLGYSVLAAAPETLQRHQAVLSAFEQSGGLSSQERVVRQVTSELAERFCPDLVPGGRYDLAAIVVPVPANADLPPIALRMTGLPTSASTEQIESWIRGLKLVAAAAGATMRATDAHAAEGTGLATGVFAGPIRGLGYETPTTTGRTNETGEFRYRAGEAVTFRIGGLVLGSVQGAPRVNLAQLVNRVDGKIDKLHDPIVTNMARLVQTLDQDGNVEGGITIAPAVHELVEPMVINFNQADTDAALVDPVVAPGLSGNHMVSFSGDHTATFAGDPAVTALLDKLNAAPGVFTASTPRTLHNAAAARNELRRNIRGIVKMTDVRIPVRDGSYVCADVFRPADDSRHPVVMNKGFYGKSFDHGCIGNDEQAQRKEELEDRYFSGNPDGLQYENHESVDSSVWVPAGYVCIRVDSRGVGNSPGMQAPFSVQQAEDYYDAIEWAGTQSWSNGKVGLWGMSYLAITQHSVASLRPPHLAAMIALGTDSDLYTEAFYGGGLFGEGFWTWWRKAMAGHNFHGERQETDWLSRVLATPFDDPEAYGSRGSIFMRPEIDQATAPVWIVGPQTGVVIHQLGSSETYIRSTGVAAKKFDFVDAWFTHSYKESTIAEHMRFFDHWLNGIDNGVMDGPPVRVQVRTGNGGHYVSEEAEWPIARTDYRRWYLDATPSDWPGDGLRTDFLRVRDALPANASHSSYDAHLDLGQPSMSPVGPIGGTPRWSTGVSFVSDPLSEDMVLAGYMKVGLWVSSTSSDMDVFVSLRVIDEHDREVRYESLVPPVDPTSIHPVGHGLLKVSHRRLDELRSTQYLPVHTHAEKDYAPIDSGEIVAIELALNPSSALIRRGYRLRIDVQPYSPAGVPARAYDSSYHLDATNSVYTGPDHPSYVQLPIVPLRQSASMAPSPQATNETA